MRARAAALIALVVGCAATEDPYGVGGRPGIVPVSGTRLRTLWLKPEFGSPLAAGFRDEELGMPCRFVRAVDGRLRCLPVDGERNRLHDLTYADPACTLPVAPADPAGEGFVWTGRDSACAPAVRAFRRLGPMTVRGRYARHEARCDGIDGEPYEATALEEVTLRAATAVLEEGPAAGGIAPVFFHAEDGARTLAHWRAVAFDQPCDFRLSPTAPVTAADGSLRCLPAAAQAGVRLDGVYADASCRIPAAAVRDPLCPPAHLGLAPDLDRCPGRVRVFRLGPPLETRFRRDGAACTGEPARPDAHHAVGDEIPPGALPAGSLEPPIGEARLRHVNVLTAAGIERAPWLHDVSLGGPCVPERTADDTLRCVPATPIQVSAAFYDSQCRMPVGHAPREACAAGYALERGSDGAITRVLRVLRPYMGPVYVRTEIGCQGRTMTSDDALYALGAEVRFIDLAELETVVR